LQRLRFEVGRLKKKKFGFNAKSGARDGKREFGGGEMSTKQLYRAFDSSHFSPDDCRKENEVFVLEMQCHREKVSCSGCGSRDVIRRGSRQRQVVAPPLALQNPERNDAQRLQEALVQIWTQGSKASAASHLPGRNPLHDNSKNVATFSMSQSSVYQQVTGFASLAAGLMVAESEELLIVCPLARQAKTIVCSGGISNIRIHGRHCEWRSASFALAIW
jgi:hypothetical protein